MSHDYQDVNQLKNEIKLIIFELRNCFSRETCAFVCLATMSGLLLHHHHDTPVYRPTVWQSPPSFDFILFGLEHYTWRWWPHFGSCPCWSFQHPRYPKQYLLYMPKPKYISIYYHNLLLRTYFTTNNNFQAATVFQQSIIFTMLEWLNRWSVDSLDVVAKYIWFECQRLFALSKNSPGKIYSSLYFGCLIVVAQSNCMG